MGVTVLRKERGCRWRRGEGEKDLLTCAMLEMARGHSEGCRALRTNTRTRMSAERGARPGGGEADDKSQTAAVIVPQGGDVYRTFCLIDRDQWIGRETQHKLRVTWTSLTACEE
jgi:hypothetical protein